MMQHVAEHNERLLQGQNEEGTRIMVSVEAEKKRLGLSKLLPLADVVGLCVLPFANAHAGTSRQYFIHWMSYVYGVTVVSQTTIFQVFSKGNHNCIHCFDPIDRIRIRIFSKIGG